MCRGFGALSGSCRVGRRASRIAGSPALPAAPTWRAVQHHSDGGRAAKGLARSGVPLDFSLQSNSLDGYQEKAMASAVSLPTTGPAERSAVVSKTVARAAALLGLTNAALARTVGVSEATGSRLRSGRCALEPGSKPYELALLLVRLFRALDAVVGGDAVSLRSCAVAANHAQGGVPRDLVQTATGRVTTLDYLVDEPRLTCRPRPRRALRGYRSAEVGA